MCMCMCTCMCMCVYVYMHVHIRTSTHAHTYMNTYIHAYIHTDRQTYMHTCIHAYMHTCIHACIHTHIPIYTWMPPLACEPCSRQCRAFAPRAQTELPTRPAVQSAALRHLASAAKAYSRSQTVGERACSNPRAYLSAHTIPVF